jgi:hypothetical protein
MGEWPAIENPSRFLGASGSDGSQPNPRNHCVTSHHHRYSNQDQNMWYFSVFGM